MLFVFLRGVLDDGKDTLYIAPVSGYKVSMTRVIRNLWHLNYTLNFMQLSSSSYNNNSYNSYNNHLPVSSQFKLAQLHGKSLHLFAEISVQIWTIAGSAVNLHRITATVYA